MDMDLSLYKVVSDALNAHAVLPPNLTDDFNLLSILLLRLSEPPYRVLVPTGVHLNDILSDEDKAQFENMIETTGPIEGERVLKGLDSCGAGAHASVALPSLLSAMVRGEAEHARLSDLAISGQTVESLRNSAICIRNAMKNYLQKLVTNTGLLVYCPGDARICIGVVTRTYRGKLVANVLDNSSQDVSGSVKATDAIGLEAGGGVKTDNMRSVDATGVLGVDFLCFPLHRQGNRITLRHPISLIALGLREKKNLQMWVKGKQDVGLIYFHARPTDPSGVLRKLQIEDTEDGITPNLDDRAELRDKAKGFFRRKMSPDMNVSESFGGISGVDLWNDDDTGKDILVVFDVACLAEELLDGDELASVIIND
jgi:hypothetical protein